MQSKIVTLVSAALLLASSCHGRPTPQQRQGLHSHNAGFNSHVGGSQSQGGGRGGGGQSQGISSASGPGGSGVDAVQSSNGFGNDDFFKQQNLFGGGGGGGGGFNNQPSNGGGFGNFPAFQPLQFSTQTQTQSQGQGASNGADLQTITADTGVLNTNSKTESENNDKLSRTNSGTSIDLAMGVNSHINAVNQNKNTFQGQTTTKQQITGKGANGLAGSQNALQKQVQFSANGNVVSDSTLGSGSSSQKTLSSGRVDNSGALQTSGTQTYIAGRGISYKGGSSAMTNSQTASQGAQQSKFEGFPNFGGRNF